MSDGGRWNEENKVITALKVGQRAPDSSVIA